MRPLALPTCAAVIASAWLCLASSRAHACGDELVYPDMPAGRPPAVVVEGADAADEASMRPYAELLLDTDVHFDMVPIRGGTFTIGSPATEAGRGEDEGPQRKVAIEPFWMGRCEVTWNEYHVFMQKLDLLKRRDAGVTSPPQDAWADAVSRPTPPYRPMDFEMGVDGYPAISMTQFAARQYTHWLSMKTGRFYRLPTEAEWEYACRAGTATAYSFGDAAELDDHGWYFDNADDAYHPVGRKKPNPWGLYDMHGNVAEWCIDQYVADAYAGLTDGVTGPIAWSSVLYPHVVRGGSWDDDPERLRSAARRGSNENWKQQDPQLPKSIWYLTDARFVGLRVLRPLREPSAEEQARYWDADVESIREIQQKQRRGSR